MKFFALAILIAFSVSCATPENYQKPRNCFQKMTRAGVDDPVRTQATCRARGNW